VPGAGCRVHVGSVGGCVGLRGECRHGLHRARAAELEHAPVTEQQEGGEATDQLAKPVWQDFEIQIEG